MRFLADMGVDIRVVEWLRGRGHDAVHVRDLGMHRAPDEQILAGSLADNRIVLTFDLDFGTLAVLAHDQPVRIVLFRMSNARLAHVVARLAVVLHEAAEPLTRSAVILVEDARLRIRYLPIERAET